MTRQRSLLILVAVPAVVSLVVTLLVIIIWERNNPTPPPQLLPTHAPTSLSPGQVVPTNDTSSSTTDNDTGIPSASGNGGSNNGETGDEPSSPIPEGCENPSHTVAAGEVLGSIAEQYGVLVADITAMNQLLDPEFNPDFLSPGQVLVIPVCGIPTATPTAIPTPTVTPTIPPPQPTPTLPPPGTVELIIIEVLNPGDITTERVEILNEGTPVQMEGWLLSNGAGITFEFPEGFRLYTGGRVAIHTGVGQDTPIDLYWGLDDPLWTPGDRVLLIDPDGDIHDQFEVPEP